MEVFQHFVTQAPTSHKNAHVKVACFLVYLYTYRACCSDYLQIFPEVANSIIIYWIIT